MEIEIDYGQAPTIWEAIQSEAVVIGLMGPFGSGKSVGCAGWVMHHAGIQPPGLDGIRHSRFAVIRNTAPELKSTTIKTFTDQFPEGPHGRVVFTSPISYHITFPTKGNTPGIDCEIIFIALDTPRDVRKLLSLELTGAWVNEAREVPKTIVDALTGRTARYPAGKLGKTDRPKIIMDTNAPDEAHWWGKAFGPDNKPVQYTTPDGREFLLTWQLFQQPPAMLELTQLDEDRYESKEPGYAYEYGPREVVSVGSHDQTTWWGVNPEAENLANLNPLYYPTLVLNKSRDFIRIYAQGRYGYVQEGKPVVPEFNADFMVREFATVDDRPLIIGIDIGGGTLQPAAAILQRHERGAWLCHSEVVATDMGVDRFAEVLRQHCHEHYPDHKIGAVYTDPAAETRDEIFETKVNDHLRSKGFPVRPAPTNAWKVRRLAIAQPCNRMIDGQPGLIVHRRCRMIVDGLKGKWEFRKLQIVGQDMYAEVPSKNEYSHPCEALGYALLGGGEKRIEQERPSGQDTQWRDGWTAPGEFSVY